MKTITIVKDTSAFWRHCYIYEGDEKNRGKLIRDYCHYVDVDESFIYEYASAGGHDTRHKGDLIWKYYIADCNLVRVEEEHKI